VQGPCVALYRITQQALSYCSSHFTHVSCSLLHWVVTVAKDALGAPASPSDSSVNVRTVLLLRVASRRSQCMCCNVL
jgi:hypothetical protein